MKFSISILSILLLGLPALAQQAQPNNNKTVEMYQNYSENKLLQLGKEKLELKDYESSITIFTALINKNEQLATAWYYRAKSYQMQADVLGYPYKDMCLDMHEARKRGHKTALEKYSYYCEDFLTPEELGSDWMERDYGHSE